MPMKLQPDKSPAQAITGYGPGWIAVDGERITSSFVISSTGLRQPWNCQAFSDLTARHFALFDGVGVELVIFGSGDRIRFPNPSWLTPLMARRIGVETMDTRAACRTYNILSAEGRLVAGAFLIEDGAQ